MSKHNGSWNITFTLENGDELSDADLEYIANLINEGYTSGQIVGDNDEEEEE